MITWTIHLEVIRLRDCILAIKAVEVQLNKLSEAKGSAQWVEEVTQVVKLTDHEHHKCTDPA